MNTTFINARLEADRLGSLRVQGSRIAGLDVPAEASDTIVDLNGDCLLPGLINAHDHLHLNNLPAIEPPKIYPHARDWVVEVDARRRTDKPFAARVGLPRDQRLLLGALKNLLSGVTTVAHHDPLYPFLTQPSCPVSVVQNYGWSHSLYIDGETSVSEAFHATPKSWPWIVHAAEGLTEEAANEFERLESLGCIQPNSLLVHGIALSDAQRERLINAGAGLICCPSSNVRLYGKTAEVRVLAKLGRAALGTDSRLSGSRDLLEELKIASTVLQLGPEDLESIVTDVAAGLLRLPDRGRLRSGLRADLLVLPANRRLGDADRRDVRLVMINGVPRFGDPAHTRGAYPDLEWSAVSLDGVPKMLATSASRLLAESSLTEPGLDIRYTAGRAA